MVYTPDLSTQIPKHLHVTCNRGTVLAVGWIEAGRPFSTGVTPRAVVEHLNEHLAHSKRLREDSGITVFEACFCSICWDAGVGNSWDDWAEKRSCPEESANIYIPFQEGVYISPGLVIHYIQEHSYRPPDEFIENVLVCPSPNSEEYKNLVSEVAPWLCA